GAGAEVMRSQTLLAMIGPGASVGPFSYLRAGTVLGKGGKIGGFVETKNAQIGEDAKVPHLSYVGDAEIGEGANIGAATIFANYDGVDKHRTTVGKQVRVGSDSVLVAPVTLGDGSATGAGAVVRKDVLPRALAGSAVSQRTVAGKNVRQGAFAVRAVAQRNVEGWTLRRRAGIADEGAARVALGVDGDTEGAVSASLAAEDHKEREQR